MKVSLYLRISEDTLGQGLGVQRQEAECRELVERRGWEVRDVFVDNDISATTGVRRPQFEALLASKPEAIVCWHTDRLVRQVKELQRVIDVGVNVYAVQSGELDLATPAGRATAVTITAWAQYEGEQKSVRQKAAAKQRAAAGLPWWPRRPFGLDYETDAAGERTGIKLHTEEAAALRKCYEDLLAGLSLRRVSQDLAATGLLTNTGRPWTAGSLRPVLLNARNAGIRVYGGVEVKADAWPAVVPVEVYRAVVRLLRDPARVSNHKLGGRGHRENLLTGLAVCGKCGAGIRAAWRGKAGAEGSYKVYGCRGQHCVTTPAEWADSRVLIEIARRFDLTGELLPTFLAGEGVGEQVDTSALAAEGAALRDRKRELGELFVGGIVDAPTLTAGVRSADRRLEEIEGILEANIRGKYEGLLFDVEDVAQFADEDPDRWRLVVQKLCREIRLMPRGRGNRELDPQKHIEIDFRADPMA